MSQQTAAIDGDPIAQIFAGLRGAGVWLLVSLGVLSLLFLTEETTAVKTWIESTAYNHCFLVIPIVGWLIWDRRDTLAGLSAAPIPLAALLLLPLGIAWLAAERLGIMEGRQLVLLTMMEVLFLTMLGWRLWYALLGPLLYLYFLVPFGEFVTPQLQDITTWFTRHGLAILGIPAYIDGYIIEIPEGTFFVAEACAGLRFLIASIAFGALYALMMYRGPVRRIVFILLSIAVPIVANGIRAMGIVVLGHMLGSAEAGAADHLIYGWIFFSFVILLLILAGLPFREDAPLAKTAAPLAQSAPGGRGGSGLLAGVAVVLLAAIGPLLVWGLDRATAAPANVALRPLRLSPACLDTGQKINPPATVIGQTIAQRVDCGGILLDVQVEVFSRRSTAAPVNAERRRLTRAPDAEDVAENALFPNETGAARAWRITSSTEPSMVAASALWVDGVPAMPGLPMRLGMARTSVFGGAFAPVLVTIVPVANWHEIGQREKRILHDSIARFVLESANLDEQVRAIAKTAGAVE